MKPVICKYCAETFTPLPGKPGYINECPECLHEKTAPLSPKPLSPGSAKQRKQLPDPAKARENLIKSLMVASGSTGKPISEEMARKRYDRLMAMEDAEEDNGPSSK
jgi:hypothetical protein